MKYVGSMKISNYQVLNHIVTIKLGDLLIQGMKNLVSFNDFNNKECIGEFKCDGRVERIRLSNDKKEIFIYTDKYKFYRI